MVWYKFLVIDVFQTWYLINWSSQASFSFIFVFLHKLHFYIKNMRKNVHPVYGAGIQTHNLQDMSLLP